ncbi:hypothetical protein RclHR1_33150001 [Rhizophagus clarus]|uniref:Uncharacterized protein n=1 Tax=Rhizophagus clarus TaxID=94130 RepID=A0A2Z6R9M4_9GLOM|nr:hypothetical protein RclHR1_33150001 [Rhizophagus clarus]
MYRRISYNICHAYFYIPAIYLVAQRWTLGVQWTLRRKVLSKGEFIRAVYISFSINFVHQTEDQVTT